MPRAERDLANIYERIHASSSQAARDWYRGLRKNIRSLSSRPNGCAMTPEARDLRQLLYGHKPHIYRVIYRVIESDRHVEILHIRHGARDEFTPQDLR